MSKHNSSPESAPKSLEFKVNFVRDALFLDRLLTREPLEHLHWLIEVAKTDQKAVLHLIDFISRPRVAQPMTHIHTPADTLWKYITQDMYEFFLAAFGPDEGSNHYKHVCGESRKLVKTIGENGAVEWGKIQALSAQLENIFSVIEQMIFMSSPDATRSFLLKRKDEVEKEARYVREHLENGATQLSNGRRIDESTKNLLQQRAFAYGEALTRLKIASGR